MIAVIGVKTIKNSHMPFNLKNIIVMATILILGLGGHVGINVGIKITDIVSISGLSLAALVGVILNAIFKKYEESLNK